MSESDSAPRACPVSDVSTGVGLAGLAGLFAWVMFCRGYPAIADAFGLGGPHVRLSGPYASLVSVLVVGLPMVAWAWPVWLACSPG